MLWPSKKTPAAGCPKQASQLKSPFVMDSVIEWAEKTLTAHLHPLQPLVGKSRRKKLYSPAVGRWHLINGSVTWLRSGKHNRCHANNLVMPPKRTKGATRGFLGSDWFRWSEWSTGGVQRKSRPAAGSVSGYLETIDCHPPLSSVQLNVRPGIQKHRFSDSNQIRFDLLIYAWQGLKLTPAKGS